MVYAFWCMNALNGKYKNSYMYKRSKEEWAKVASEFMMGKMKGKLAGDKNGMYGRHHTEEAKRKQGEASRNRPKESWEAIRKKKTGMKMSDEFREKCRKRMMGNTLVKGRTFTWSEETKNAHKERFRKLWQDDEYRKMMQEKQKNNPRSKGKHWHLSEDAKLKHSQAAAGKHCWNNGVINKMSKECPGEGWVKGMLRLNK